MPQLRALCDQQQWLMMLDEVQSGNGLTGEYFAYQHHDLLPEVVTTAKGLGNGLPIGACLAQGKAAETLGPGNHGSTYGGNPLVCAAAQAVVDTIAEQKLCDNAKQLGNWLIRGFREQLGDKAIIKDIRGQGLMIGIELTQPCGELVNQAREKGLLINVTAGNVIRLLPPLIINQAQAEILLASIVDIVNSFAESH